MKLRVQVRNISGDTQQVVATLVPSPNTDSADAALGIQDNKEIWNESNPASMLMIYVNNPNAYGKFIPGQELDITIEPVKDSSDSLKS